MIIRRMKSEPLPEQSSHTQRRVSIRDVAKACGLSIATVSKALNPGNQAHSVAADTRQRVIEIAAKMGYHPDFAGRSLVSGRVRTIGIYMAPNPWTHLSGHYEGPLMRGIEIACRANGYDLLIINLAGHESIETCYKSLIERRVMGLIFLRVPARGKWLTDLHQHTQAAVFLDAVDPDPSTSAVIFDNAAAIRLAIEHLVSLGHRRIGFLGPCTSSPSADSKLREKTYTETLEQMHLPSRVEWLHNRSRCQRDVDEIEEFCQAEGYLGARSIMNSGGDHPTALIAYNNPVAWGAMQYCQENQIRIPGQVSMIAVDDSDIARITTPKLTCIVHPLEEMGACAVNLLLESQTGGESAKPRQPCFSPKLLVRQSTAAPTA